MTFYEDLITAGSDGRPLSVELLVLPGSSLMTLACAGDPMRAANRVSGRKLFEWRYVSIDGQNPSTSAGMAWPVTGVFNPGTERDIVAVIAGFRAAEIRDRKLVSAVYRASRRARVTLGIESGAWLLARAGLLDGRAATTHWEDFEDFAATFPLVDLKPDRYVADSRFVTTSGASPTFDMMIDLVRQYAGIAVAHDVASVFIHEPSRGAGDFQSHLFFGHSSNPDIRVVEAVRIMEKCLDAPVTIAAIARRLSLSVRGLEQLFARETGQTPGAYFLTLRLNAARRFVLDTNLPMTDIASRTGFTSVTAFSRAFRRVHGEAPSHYRSYPERK